MIKKSEGILLGPLHSRAQFVNDLSPFSSNLKPNARILGVIFHPDLNLDKHVKKVIQSGFYHQINIAKIKYFLYIFDLKIVVHASVPSL